MTQDELLEYGKQLFNIAQWHNQCDLKKDVAKILSIEEWISHDDDTAIFIQLIDKDGKMLWQTSYDVIWGNDAAIRADALALYLQDKYRCPLEKRWK